jgi:hypothetical protein
MTTRKVNAAKAASAATTVASVQPAPVAKYNRADTIARLSDADAQQRVLILSALPMGEVAAIGGKVGKIGASVNEVLNIKMCDKHGIDWVKVYNTTTANLSEGDKTRKKAIHASLEGIRETIQANSGGDKAKARDILRKVKDWGLGVHQNKQSNPKGNAKKGIKAWALSYDNMPSSYRRIMDDKMEDVTPAEADALMVVADAMAAFFDVVKVGRAKAVLTCTGKAAYEAL